MRMQYMLYGKRPEYCIVIDRMGHIALQYEGDIASVKFDYVALINIILANNLSYILHSHPFGIGTAYSSMDKRVFESWAITTDIAIEHRITDFVTLSRYVVTPDDCEIYRIGAREIGPIESLTSWPWGVRL